MSGTIRTLKSTVYNVSQNEQNFENINGKFDTYKEAISKQIEMLKGKMREILDFSAKSEKKVNREIANNIKTVDAKIQ